MLTHRQAEALWAARERGTAIALLGSRAPAFRRVIRTLQRAGYLTLDLAITEDGRKVLAKWSRGKEAIRPALEEDARRRMLMRFGMMN